jgi:hypothetical protein
MQGNLEPKTQVMFDKIVLTENNQFQKKGKAAQQAQAWQNEIAHANILDPWDIEDIRTELKCITSFADKELMGQSDALDDNSFYDREFGHDDVDLVDIVTLNETSQVSLTKLKRQMHLVKQKPWPFHMLTKAITLIFFLLRIQGNADWITTR